MTWQWTANKLGSKEPPDKYCPESLKKKKKEKVKKLVQKADGWSTAMEWKS